MSTPTHALRDTKRQLVDEMNALLGPTRAGSRSRLTRRHLQKFNLLYAAAEGLQGRIEETQRREQIAGDQEYRKAWSAYLRCGFEPSTREPGITENERRALTRGERRENRDMGAGLSPTGGAAFPGSLSGYFVPEGFEDQVDSALQYSTPMLDICTFIDTERGGPLPFPQDNDLSIAGEQVNENAQVSDQDIPIGQSVFSSFKYSSKMVKVSLELVQDFGFPLENYLIDKFGFRIGRALNPLFTNGSGSGQPKGITTGIPIGVGPSTTPAVQGNENATSPSPQTQVGALDLFNLELSVDPVFRRGGAYMMHDTTLTSIKQLKDKNGRLMNIWRAEGGPFGSINGYPVYPNRDMAQLGAGNITVLFGQLNKYAVRRAGSMWMRRISQLYALTGQVAFILMCRRDGFLLDAGSHPVKAIQQAS